MTPFDPLHAAGIPRIPDGVVSRSASAENPTGQPGQGGRAGGGRKGAPCIPRIEPGQSVDLLDTPGPGVVRHIWMTLPDRSPEIMRNLILRAWWDGAPHPSVEAPLGDFFGLAHGRCVPLTTALTTMTLGRGLNAYYPMPFGTHARISIENDTPSRRPVEFFFYQIDYELHDSLPPDAGRLHARFRRENPTMLGRDFVVLDGAEGPGMFLGCVLGVRALGPEWWGEGEFKFFIDDDEAHATICGTGTEDYFGGAWGMAPYQTPWHGCPFCIVDGQFPDPLVSLYRFHGPDPVYFARRLRVTVQQIGYRDPGGLFERSDDWSALALWYQRRPSARPGSLPDRSARSAGIL